MPRTVFFDLAEFGLPLITPDDTAFPALVEEIRRLPTPFGPPADTELNPSAILRNESGRAIVGMTYVWRFTTADGRVRPNWHATMGSSMQLDVLAGRASVPPDGSAFILPGSKRLITVDRIFGNNSDVLPPRHPQGGGIGMSGGGRRLADSEETVEIALQLDAVVLDDGLCAGPDESNLLGNLIREIDHERAAAAEAAQALRNGASRGQLFEMLRPLASQTPPPPPSEAWRAFRFFQSMFANMAIRRLTDADDADLLPWFESYANATPLSLRRR